MGWGGLLLHEQLGSPSGKSEVVFVLAFLYSSFLPLIWSSCWVAERRDVLIGFRRARLPRTNECTDMHKLTIGSHKMAMLLLCVRLDWNVYYVHIIPLWAGEVFHLFHPFVA